MSDKPEWMDKPNPLGPTRKRDPIHLPNLTPEELAKVNESLVLPGGPKIPDAPDISQPPDQAEVPATDAEFFVNGRYRPHGRKSRSGATFKLVEHAKEPQHQAFDASINLQRQKRDLPPRAPSFYVESPRGTIGWVPWIGSTVVWPWEAGWAADLVGESASDPKPSEQKKR